MASRTGTSAIVLFLMLAVLILVHIGEFDSTLTPISRSILKNLTSCTVDPPGAVARHPLRSYIPPHAHILEVGKDIEYLIQLSIWQGESKLCPLLQAFEDFERGGTEQREKIMSQWHEYPYPFRNNSVIGDILLDLNETLANTTESAGAPVHVVLVVEVYCQELFNSYISGTGNWLWVLYAMRLNVLVASRSGNIQVDFLFDCHDAADRQSEMVYPWLTGYFSSSWIYEVLEEECQESEDITHQSQTITSQFEEMRQIVHRIKSVGDVCPSIKTSLPIMLPFLRHELHRMAVALVGMPEKLGWAVKNEFYPPQTFLKPLVLNESSGTPPAPLLKDVELDDVAIHFRCGDLMHIQGTDYGFMKFSSFGNRIQNMTGPFSIGIITQPFFPNSTNRPADHEDGDDHLCYVTAHAFVDYLQARFPQARIRIRNDPDETVALAYARFVVAKQTFSPLSTFSTFPALVSMGRGYIGQPPPLVDPLELITPPFPRYYSYDVTTSDSNGVRAVSIANSTTTHVEFMDDPDILRCDKVWEIRTATERNTTVEETLINWFTS
jgi:hypothetical protein